MTRGRIPPVLVLAIAILALGGVAANLDAGQHRTPPPAGNSSPPIDNQTRSNTPFPSITSPPPTDSTTPTRTAVPTSTPRGGAWTPPSWLLLGGLLFTVGVAAVFLFVRSGDREPAVADEPRDEESDTLDRMGEAAGDAADRIDSSTDVANEVYRAWTEMVRHLDIDEPETVTPDEFKSNAIAAGMDPADVSELTRLFEEVRYGERDPGEREARAVSLLRRIEAAYAADRDARDANGGEGE